MKNYLVYEIVANKNVKISVHTRVKTSIKIDPNRPDIFICEKKKQ